MKIKEYVAGSGIFSVPVSQLPRSAWFVRNTSDSKEGELDPLLHVCERDIDPGMREPTYVVMTGVVTWDQINGHYYCQACKHAFRSEEELEAVWEDGLGTGAEGQA
jgi:hypothetical protein